MAIATATSAATNTIAGQSKTKDSASALKTLSSDFESFLRLLTTQLKNQDPTQPLDTNQFTQQIVQLSGVEQAIATNKHLEDMMSLMGQNQSSNLVNYIGKQVESAGNKGVLAGNRANFVYNLASAADKVQVTISDVGGAVVFSGQGAKNSGRNVVYWDGLNSFTGAKMPAGTYTISVNAKDGADKDVVATTHTTGVVTSVETQDGKSQLMIGDVAVALDKVLAIRDAAAGA